MQSYKQSHIYIYIIINIDMYIYIYTMLYNYREGSYNLAKSLDWCLPSGLILWPKLLGGRMIKTFLQIYAFHRLF